MYKLITPIAMSTALLMASCAGPADDGKIIDRPDFKSTDGLFSIEALEALGRVSDPQISPDRSKILYSVSYESVEENASNADLYVMNTDGSEVNRITRTAKSERNAVWLGDGKRIAFLYPDADGKPQIWTMNADGSDRRQASTVEKGVEGFLLSPDQKRVVMISTIKYAHTAEDVYPDLPKSSGRIIDDIMYKHWDEWVTEIPHPFIADFDGSKVGEATDIMADEPLFEAPMKPFGGVESFAWTADSKQLVYVSRKKTGKEYSLSTNSDLYLYDIASGSTRNLTEGMMATTPTRCSRPTAHAWRG